MIDGIFHTTGDFNLAEWQAEVGNIPPSDKVLAELLNRFDLIGHDGSGGGFFLVYAPISLLNDLMVAGSEREDLEDGEEDEDKSDFELGTDAEEGDPAEDDDPKEDDDPDEWDARKAWEPIYRSENDQRLLGKKWD